MYEVNSLYTSLRNGITNYWRKIWNWFRSKNALRETCCMCIHCHNAPKLVTGCDPLSNSNLYFTSPLHSAWSLVSTNTRYWVRGLQILTLYMWIDIFKQVTKRVDTNEGQWSDWNWRTDGDIMVNGAFFVPSGEGLSAQYTKASSVEPKSAALVSQLTIDAGVFGQAR